MKQPANRNDDSRNDVRELPPPQHTPPVLSAEQSGSGDNLWALLNDRLSGRWPHAILAGIALAAVLGYLGYNATSVKYDGVGMIQVSPKITPLVRDTPETTLTPLYASYIQTEARMVKSPQVLHRTLHHLDLNEMPWPSVPEALRNIETHLRVQSERNTELIQVAYRANSADLAQTVANAVLRAYDDVRGSVEGDNLNINRQRLRAERGSLREQQRQMNMELQNLVGSTGYSVTDFEPLILQRIQFIEVADAEMRRLRNALEIHEARIVEYPELEHNDKTLHERELERFDPELAELSRQRNQVRLEFAKAEANFAPVHHAYIAAENRLRLIERLYNERLLAVKDDYIASGYTPMVSSPGEMRTHIERLEREADEQRAIAKRMSEWQRAINDIRIELDQIERRRLEVEERIHQLDIEAESIRTGRIQIASYAERPLRPSQDRRVPFAAIGGMGGFGMGIALFFMMGSIDRRVYVARQLAHGSSGKGRLLGVLPALPQRASNAESLNVAAHCVHQIRNQIEAVYRPTKQTNGSMNGSHPPGRIILVSSPYQGDGKTSLVMSLGASYAISGGISHKDTCRVLLVDCDFVGRNLTTHAMMGNRPGLREALLDPDGTNVCDFVMPLPIASVSSNGAVTGASVLPVGIDPAFGPEMIRRERLETIFAQLQKKFDVIVVDTGPLFGSIETLPAAAAATNRGGGIILTMQRGRRYARLEECVAELQHAGARYLGLVLNHARLSDCDRYVSKSRISAVISAQDVEYFSNGSRTSEHKTSDPPPRPSRNALLRAMQVTTRSGM